MQLNDLISRCRKGQRLAQEELYRNYSDILFGICLKYSRNRQEAQDHLHDSFMTIYDKIGQYRGKGSFEGWMKRITINTVLQQYRKKKALSLVPEQLEAPEIQEDHEEQPGLQPLLKCIQDLPTKYRITFNLYVLDGYSHQEIAEMLGTSVGTSKSNLSRAKVILREKIEELRATPAEYRNT